MTDEGIAEEDSYARLPEFARKRENDLRAMLVPAVELTDAYGRLVSQAVEILGQVTPASPHDATLRDVMADIFDFLYEWRRPVLEGRTRVAFPIGRRAFESLSLFAAMIQDPALINQWERGKEIPNREIRKALAQGSFAESEEQLRATYKFFSQGAHPNRVLVFSRFLGEGNEYVLGSIGSPSLVLVLEHLDRLASCWFWFGAAAAYNWRHLLLRHVSWGPAYSATAKLVPPVHAWIRENWSSVLEEEKALVASGSEHAKQRQR